MIRYCTDDDGCITKKHIYTCMHVIYVYIYMYVCMYIMVYAYNDISNVVFNDICAYIHV